MPRHPPPAVRAGSPPPPGSTEGAVLAARPPTPPFFPTPEEQETFSAVMRDWKAKLDNNGHSSSSGAAAAAAAPAAHIPRFYFSTKRPKRPDRQLLREVAREAHLQRMAGKAAENSELEALWRALEDNSTAVEKEDKEAEAMLDYRQFCAVKALFPKFAAFFRPAIFMQLKHDDLGRISINQFFDLFMRKVSVEQTRISLHSYDVEGQGYLTELDLETYILDLLTSNAIPYLSDLDEQFYTTYTVYAVRKFFFFLDPKRTGRIKIADLLVCDIMGEFQELQEDIPKEVEHINWFSMPFVTRVHAIYVGLDKDGNGLLSKSEFQQFDGGTLTEQIVDQIFQERTTWGNEMDFRLFLDFVLAREYPRTAQSQQFFFKLLDVQHCNYLNLFAINYFWRGIKERGAELGVEVVDVLDIKNEIFDMVKPKNPLYLTLKDLIRSRKGHTVCSMLTDIRGFLTYEDRESTASDQDSFSS